MKAHKAQQIEGCHGTYQGCKFSESPGILDMALGENYKPEMYLELIFTINHNYLLYYVVSVLLILNTTAETCMISHLAHIY